MSRFFHSAVRKMRGWVSMLITLSQLPGFQEKKSERTGKISGQVGVLTATIDSDQRRSASAPEKDCSNHPIAPCEPFEKLPTQFCGSFRLVGAQSKTKRVEDSIRPNNSGM